MTSVDGTLSNPIHYPPPKDKDLNDQDLKKTPQTASNIKKRNACKTECLACEEFCNDRSLNPGNCKHQKTALKENRRIYRVVRTKSLNKEINEKLFLDSSCKLTVNENIHTSEITSLSPSCTLTDDELEYVVEHFRHLVNLDLRDCIDLTDQGLKHLQKLPSLKHLYLAYNNFLLPKNNITENGLLFLSKLRLQSLRLMGFDFIINTLLSLWDGFFIEFLYINKCNITDEGMFKLNRLPCLKKLVINSCRFITDDGVASLKSLPLELLIIQNCPQVSDSLQRHCKNKVEVRKLFSDLGIMP